MLRPLLGWQIKGFTAYEKDSLLHGTAFRLMPADPPLYRSFHPTDTTRGVLRAGSKFFEPAKITLF